MVELKFAFFIHSILTLLPVMLPVTLPVTLPVILIVVTLMNASGKLSTLLPSMKSKTVLSFPRVCEYCGNCFVVTRLLILVLS